MHDFFHSRTVIITQPISITHISLVYAVEVNFVLCNSMLKYAINRPISTLGLKPSGPYRSLGVITVQIWKTACINLLINMIVDH